MEPSKLTNDQIAQCARIVTGYDDCWKSIQVSEHGTGHIRCLHSGIEWLPSFEHTHKGRSQALALVEWLFDKTDPLPNAAAMRDRIGRLVHLRNIPALMAMVLELEKS